MHLCLIAQKNVIYSTTVKPIYEQIIIFLHTLCILSIFVIDKSLNCMIEFIVSAILTKF